MFLRDTHDILGRVAIADAFGCELTYGELENMSKEYAEYIPSRTLIMILCDYGIDTVAFYYCQMNNHVVPILLDKKLEQDLLEQLIKTYQPEYIWCMEREGKRLLEYTDDIIQCGGQHVLIKTNYSKCNMNPQLALLMTTSGSTGSAKFVRISYENLRCNMADYVKAVNLQPDDRAITTLPMYYCYGLSNLHIHWMVGASVYVTDYSMMNIAFWDFLKKSNITNFAGVPYVYDILMQIGFFEKSYPSLKFLTQAGAKLAEDKQAYIAEQLTKKGILFYICYGQTEATTYISLLSHECAEKKLGSVGKALENVKIEVTESKGELICRGKSVSLGYAYSRKDLMSSNQNQGVLRTGDIAYIDEDGDIFLKGRIKRFVKILGSRISLDEMEKILDKHFEGIEFACVGQDNQIKICYSGQNDLNTKILEFCVGKFKIKKSMLICRNIMVLPRGNSGKILYKKLEE